MSKKHSFSLEDLLKEMEENDDWWKTCVKCYLCPMFTKNCSHKRYCNRKKYFCTCRSKGQKK